MYQKTYKEELKRSKRFTSPNSINHLALNTQNVISIGNQTGEGWLLTGEMIELIEDGVNNIICMQPFGCLPNHITGKGQIKELKRIYNKANIIPIDYDPSASETNQLNRIKLMMSAALKNLKNEAEGEDAHEEIASDKKIDCKTKECTLWNRKLKMTQHLKKEKD